MTRATKAAAVLFGVAALVLAAFAIAEEDAGGTAEPVIDTTSSATTRYVPIAFSSHDAHAGKLGIACTACHHTTKEGEAPEQMCSDCHDVDGMKPNLAEAAHEKCRGCHVKYRQEHPKSPAPVKCLQCHEERK